MIREMLDLAALVAGASPPDAVRHEAARLTLDSLACIAGGARTAIGAAARGVVEGAAPVGRAPGRAGARSGTAGPSASGLALGPATVAASRVRTSCVAAAAANARAGHALDADDTYMMLHFGVPTVAAGLAVGEAAGASGGAVVDAVAVGFEAGARVLRAFGPLVSLRDGRVAGYARPLWAPVPLVFGAAGAAARALGLTARQVEHAFAIAAANAPLPLAHKWAEHTGGRALGSYKYVDAGHCAAVGVEAALLAAAGLTGITGLFEGTDSFWQVAGCREPDQAALAKGLGERWQVLDTAYKPWPSCRWLHYPLTALQLLLHGERVEAGEVEEVVVSAPAVGTAAQHVAVAPAGWVAAQFSHPHSVAMALLGVRPGVEWYAADTMARADVQAMRSRVRVVVDPASERLDGCLEDGHFTRLPAGIELRIGGRRLAARAERALGDAWTEATRLGDEDLARKLRVMTGVPRPGTAEALARAVLALPGAPGVGAVVRAMRAFDGGDRTGPVDKP